MPRQGLTVERKQTKQFIDQNPTEVVLQRASWVPDGAGGQKPAQWTEVKPQTMRLVPQTLPKETRTSAGEMVNVEFIIVAEHNADIKEDDVFVMDNRRYEIVWVYNQNGYELKAEAARHV